MGSHILQVALAGRLHRRIAAAIPEADDVEHLHLGQESLRFLLADAFDVFEDALQLAIILLLFLYIILNYKMVDGHQRFLTIRHNILHLLRFYIGISSRCGREMRAGQLIGLSNYNLRGPVFALLWNGLDIRF